MKTLLLVRHAKSSWEDLEQKDFDRPLNHKGIKDAPAMAKKIKKEKVLILDAIVSSPAKRAFDTACYFAEEFRVKKKNIIEIDKLYEPTIDAFFNTIIKLDDACKNIALFSHNPGITAFANKLTNIQVDNMPTCSVFALRILDDEWENFKAAEKEFWFFDYPKNIS